jgi:hypothetical protein
VYLREIGWGSVEWIQLAQDRDCWRAVMNMVMNLRVLAPRMWLFIKAGFGDRLVTGIVGSNLTLGMNVCLCVSVLCCLM